MACTCGPGQECQPLKPGCWGYQPTAIQGAAIAAAKQLKTLREVAIEKQTAMKLGSIGAYLLRYARAHYVTERPTQKGNSHD